MKENVRAGVRTRFIAILVLLVAIVTTPQAAGRAWADDDPTQEKWSGVVTLPGVGLEFFVTFTLGDEVAATIDIPAQGASGLGLADVRHSEKELAFSIASAGAVFTATRDADGESATGELNQMGQTFPLTMKRLSAREAEATEPNRPQMPVAPFPYEARDVSYPNDGAGTTLAGTLTIPPGDGPHPAVIMITGSGPQDRDETIFGHKPFWVIADHLSRQGVAVLRVDDRGIGGSTGSIATATTLDFATDVEAGIAFLTSQPEIDQDRIGLMGHSEGGIIAPIVASRNDNVAFIVLLAGTGVPGSEVLPNQLAKILRAAEVPETLIENRIARQLTIFDLMQAEATDDEIREAITELVLDEAGLSRNDDGSVPDQLATTIASQVAQTTSPWFRIFLTLDPREYLSKVACPVLAVNGTLDLQVDPELNLPAIRRALETAGNEDVTIRRFEGLNHLFQPAKTGQISEYGTVELTFSVEALAFIADWIQEQVGEAGGNGPAGVR